MITKDEIIRLKAPLDQVELLRELVYGQRDEMFQAANGARYFARLEKVPEIEAFVRQEEFEDLARSLLGNPYLAYLSLSGLEVRPGDPGIGAHRDWPHQEEDDGRPHLCCQFLLSLDGTSEERAPLWIGAPRSTFPLEPGDMLVYGGNVDHGVHPNHTDQTRTTLLWSMGPYWIRPMKKELWDWRAW